ncbi:ABC transporter substrate-binding protein [Deinococcus yavapaiensis]|uniref:Peptide/nickel transport system substrate-binding protein n=1 Tax=Deinococcus yavapaiensis KR-236 TaxID=694435 RepID=A0A318SK97_9DEIO|nr:ABC transporter substrate-binding protein [Deinococcus yavapaiensis]PYE54779.1 peptide/nickel transport system substrate-binding protein [Deinococcus yavapaiensis KR-236]
MRAISVAALSATLLLGVASAQTKVTKPFVWPAAWSDTPAKSAKKGGVLRQSAISDFKTYNPFTTAEAGSIPSIEEVGTTGLVTQDPRTDDFIPYMAESYKASADGKVYTFTLRKGMKFSDGQEITADDFVTTFNITMDEKVGSQARDGFIINGKPVTMKKLGTYELQVTFPSKDVTAFAKLTLAPEPDHIWGKAYRSGGAEAVKKLYSLNTPAKELVTAGAWVLSGYRVGERASFVKNKYWGEWNKDSAGNALPYLDGQSFTIVKDTNADLAAFLAGQTDIAPISKADDLAQIKSAIDKGSLKANFYPNVGPNSTSSWIVFNWNKSDDPAKQALFRNEKFRQAMSQLANRAAMVKLVLGGLGSEVYTSVYPVFNSFIPKDLKTFKYDPAAAVKTLAGLGYTKKDSSGYLVNAKGDRVEFDLVTNAGNKEREQMMQIFADEAKKVGVKVNAKSIDFNNLVNALTASGDKRPFDAILLGLSGGDNIWPFGSNVVPCDGGLHFWNMSGKCLDTDEKKISDLYFQGLQESSTAKRRAIAADLLRTESTLQPVVYLIATNYHVAFNSRVGGAMPRNLWSSYYGSRLLPLTYIK